MDEKLKETEEIRKDVEDTEVEKEALSEEAPEVVAEEISAEDVKRAKSGKA